MDSSIMIDESGNILSCLKIPDEYVTQNLIPITPLEYKFIKRYGINLAPVQGARFARSVQKKINQYLNPEKE